MSKIKSITLKVNTKHGVIPVKFEILKQINVDHFLLWSQDRICVGKALGPDKWALSETTDLLDIVPNCETLCVAK